VPDRFILLDKSNLAGRAVACYTTKFGFETLDGSADELDILCFVPESPTT
jgi:hypothetical protein